MAERTFLSVILIILSSTFLAESLYSDCVRPWVSIGTGCYTFENLLQLSERYSDSVKLCPSDSNPVDIGSEEELKILSRAVKKQLLSGNPFRGFWTSGSRTSNTEDYYWKISSSGPNKKRVDYFAWLNKDTPLQSRNNHLALAFNATTSLLGYMDVNPDYPTGLGVVCKGIVCPPPICLSDTKCVPLVEPNGCTICSKCGGKHCEVQVDVEADGLTVCTTCYCKKECDDIKKCSPGCHLVPSDNGCPKCQCPAVIVPLDVQLKFTELAPKAVDLICLTVNKLILVSEICTKRVVVRCRTTSNLEEQVGDVMVTVGIATLSIRTSYPNFIPILNECKYFLQNNLMSKIGAYAVQNVLIEVPNYMPTPPRLTQSTCLKQKGKLPCDDTNKLYELRWEFNSRIGSCRPYIHNGCQTDKENSFRTLQECRNRCFDARCFLPRNPGSCDVYNERWTYNPYTGICELFRVCEYGGNSNSFQTEEECYLVCHKMVCAEPADVGPCNSKSVKPRYRYDNVTKKCNALNWGGCFGNGNNFESYDSCEQKCKEIPLNLEEETTTLGKATSSVKTTAVPTNLPTNLSTTPRRNRGRLKVAMLSDISKCSIRSEFYCVKPLSLMNKVASIGGRAEPSYNYTLLTSYPYNLSFNCLEALLTDLLQPYGRMLNFTSSEFP